MKESNDIEWSITTRIIHWIVAVIVLLNAFGIEEGDPSHRYIGYLAIILIGIRIVIGLKGNEYERFSNWPMSMKSLKLFLQTHLKRTHHFKGHNPAAAIVYIGIWFSIVMLGVTGWMMELDSFFGDDRLNTVHGYFSNFLIALVVIHIIGMLLDSILYRRKTWLGMINGKK